ncbi:hypothetical protein [Streptosporangium sp. LJ11]|uniref:hypothetical protein n=1 Tax=Streptosporangium sp. LJ11 TaxID=3436927 RepID=UPI003F7AFFB8
MLDVAPTVETPHADAVEIDETDGAAIFGARVEALLTTLGEADRWRRQHRRVRTGASTGHKMVGLAGDPGKPPEYLPNGAKTHGLGYLRGLDRRQATMRPLIPRDRFEIASRPAAGRFDTLTLGFSWVVRRCPARSRRAGQHPA